LIVDNVDPAGAPRVTFGTDGYLVVFAATLGSSTNLAMVTASLSGESGTLESVASGLASPDVALGFLGGLFVFPYLGTNGSGVAPRAVLVRP
jgi:hypothetical protein